METQNPQPSSPKDLDQPNPKRPKMSSTTTTSDDEDHHPTTAANDGDAPLRKPKYKRRKVAILFAYCGVGYQGMQKNPGAKTIEGDLEEVLYQSGGVPEQDRGQPRRYDWARSARTDKGVSAVGQVVSGRFYIDPPGFVDRLNSYLPDQIRVFGYKRVTGSFNAKKFCDKRRYVYLIPVFALDPNCHRDRESVMASVGSGNVLVKCLECSERGRKVEGIMGKRVKGDLETVEVSISANILDAMNPENKVEEKENVNNIGVTGQEENGCKTVELSISSNNLDAIHPVNNEVENVNPMETDNIGNVADCDFDSKTENVSESVESGVPSGILSNNGGNLNSVEADNDQGILSNNGEAIHAEIKQVENDANGGNDNVSVLENGVSEYKEDKAEGGNTNGAANGEKTSEFSYGEKEKERFNRILKYYEGTHNFHNFTTRTKAEDPAAKRYIISFNADTVVNVDGIDFVKCEVVGQSFMLHQIRKMIGLAVAIMRNLAPESLIETAFSKDVRINVPMAPEVGLYLDECFFSSYNQKWKDSHEEVSMKAYAEEAEEFKMKYIYNHISSTEQKDGTVALWLHSLNYRNYPDLRVGSVDGSNSNDRIEAQDVAH